MSIPAFCINGTPTTALNANATSETVSMPLAEINPI